MASRPGQDQDDPTQDPVHAHAQHEESSAAAASSTDAPPGAASSTDEPPSAASTNVSSPPPPPSSPVERAPGDGGSSSAAAVAVDGSSPMRLFAAVWEVKKEEEEKVPPRKKKSLWRFICDNAKNKFLSRKGRQNALAQWKCRNSRNATSCESPGWIVIEPEVGLVLLLTLGKLGCERIPLVGATEHYSHILYPTRGQGVVSSNWLNLRTEYSEFRPVLGDGECFYRSFIFSYLEQVLDRKDSLEEDRLFFLAEALIQQYEYPQWLSDLVRGHSAFVRLVEKVARWKSRLASKQSPNSYCERKLVKFFNSHNTSDNIFVFLRVVAAIWICEHRPEYEQLLPGIREGYYLELWCSVHLVPLGVYADYVQMRALAATLGVSLRVEYLVDGPPQDIYTAVGLGVPRVTLLYSDRYDIIYPHPSSVRPGGNSSQSQEKER